MSEQIEGRNAVLEAFRSGKCVDKLFILDGCQDGPVRTIAREARKKDTIINYVAKERLDQLSETGAHQGVIAQVAAYEYASVEDILAIRGDLASGQPGLGEHPSYPSRRLGGKLLKKRQCIVKRLHEGALCLALAVLFHMLVPSSDP